LAFSNAVEEDIERPQTQKSFSTFKQPVHRLALTNRIRLLIFRFGVEARASRTSSIFLRRIVAQCFRGESKVRPPAAHHEDLIATVADCSGLAAGAL
jgi:hypothetical protein